MPAEPTRPYHHGDLRPALLRAAVEVIGQSGPAAMSLREVARRAGVSHAAAAYHFGDKAGLLTAVAAQGYRMLTEELRSARDARRGFLEVGVAYVRFAVSHRAAPLRHRQSRRRAAGRRGRGVVAGARSRHAMAEREPAAAARQRPGGNHPPGRPLPEHPGKPRRTVAPAATKRLPTVTAIAAHNDPLAVVGQG